MVEEVEVILGRFVIRTPIFDPSARRYKDIFRYLSKGLQIAGGGGEWYQ